MLALLACAEENSTQSTFLSSVLHSSQQLSTDEQKSQPRQKQKQSLIIDTPEFKLRLVPRSAEQIGAFYYGRGFPSAMVKKIQSLCFITVSLHNKSNALLVLDFKNWQFKTEKHQLQRYTRQHWLTKWKQNNYPKSAIATFRWTVLPEKFEFQPYEREAGNIILQRSDQTFSIQGTLLLKTNKQASQKRAIYFPLVACKAN